MLVPPDSNGPSLTPVLDANVDQFFGGINHITSDIAPGSGVEINDPTANLAQSAIVAGTDAELIAQIGEIYASVVSQVPAANGSGQFNEGGGDADATFIDLLAPATDISTKFIPVFSGSASLMDAGAQFDLEVTDEADPDSPLVSDDLNQIVSSASPTTVELLAGHTYELFVSLRVDAASQNGGGSQVNGAADYEGGVIIQELNALSNPVAGNPDLETASGFDYSISPACYTRGTAIETASGSVWVENLAIGMLVCTVANALRPIKWLGRRNYAGRFLAANPAVQPIRFRAGSLGNCLPRLDLLISPDHAMFLDGLLIPARCLVNGATIVHERGLERVDYYHVELDSHDVLLAEGAPSESFLDDDSRGMFHNAAEFAAMYRDAPAPGKFCAPRVECGFQLEVIRQRLAIVAEGIALAA